jgi:hypothetical protein
VSTRATNQRSPGPNSKLLDNPSPPKAAVAYLETPIPWGKLRPLGEATRHRETIKMNLTPQRGFSRTGGIQPIMLYQARQVV